MPEPNIPEQASRSRTIIVICALIGGVVGATASNRGIRMLFDDNASPEVIIRRTAQDVNRRLPMKVDDHIRWDKVEALPNTTLRYCYTVTGMEVDGETISKQMTPKLTENYRSSDAMRKLREIRATLVYKYSDSAGKEIVRITVPPE